MQSKQPDTLPVRFAEPDARHEAEVLRAIRDTRFGTVEVIVHQSKIVQITRSEKQRFDHRQAIAATPHADRTTGGRCFKFP